jgi:hypothetical protein
MKETKPSNPLVRIVFENLYDETEQWPPTSSETLWAEPLGPNRFRLDNIPFYVYGVALDDIVTAFPRRDEALLVFDKVEEHSGHSTYRVICTQEDSEDSLPPAFWAFIEQLKAMNCTYEGAHHTLFAIDIPPETDIAKVYALLKQGKQTGLIDLEEGFRYSSP